MPEVDVKTIEQAGETLFDSVYVPTFLKQCAARGLAITTQEDLEMALQNAILLKSAEANEAQQTSGDLHKAANVALRGFFGEDVDATEKQASDATQAAAVVSEITGDEDVAKAATLLARLGQEAAVA